MSRLRHITIFLRIRRRRHISRRICLWSTCPVCTRHIRCQIILRQGSDPRYLGPVMSVGGRRSSVMRSRKRVNRRVRIVEGLVLSVCSVGCLRSVVRVKGTSKNWPTGSTPSKGSSTATWLLTGWKIPPAGHPLRPLPPQSWVTTVGSVRFRASQPIPTLRLLLQIVSQPHMVPNTGQYYPMFTQTLGRRIQPARMIWR